MKPAMHNTANNNVPVKKVMVKKFTVPISETFVAIYASVPKAIIKKRTPNADKLLLKYSFQVNLLNMTLNIQNMELNISNTPQTKPPKTKI
jgi:hypothetical protein